MSEVIVVPADDQPISVKSDATRLIVSIDRVLKHCMCGQVPVITAKACRTLVLVSIEIDQIVAPDLETLVLVHMPYGDFYHETILDLSEMPKLQRIISLCNAIDLLHMPPSCKVYGNPNQVILSDGLSLTADDTQKDLLLRLSKYFDTPEVYMCCCFHYYPAGLDLFDLIDP